MNRQSPGRPERLARRYLARQGAREAQALLDAAPAVARRYDHVVAVPACAEHALLPGSLDALAAAAAARPGETTLVIAVVNARDSAGAQVHDSNARTLAQLRDESGGGWRELVTGCWLGRRGAVDVLCVDRASSSERRFGPRDGVGLARKVGADVAVALRCLGALRTRWIHNTDADARVPGDYFAPALEAVTGDDGASDDTGCAALIYPFWHDLESGEPAGDPRAAALLLYELSLRYYVLGLAAAGSPYAFHTVGSTLVLDSDAYVRVHGAPRLQAGEDFHLLDKLAKVGPVLSMARAPIRLLCRPSDRVPFGTGAATARIAGDDGALPLYDPRVFAALAVFLCELETVVARGGARPTRAPQIAALLEAAALPWLEEALAAARSASDPTGRRRQAMVCFDALRTLQLVHRVRDAGAPSLPWREALARAPFLEVPDDDSAAGWRLALLRAEQRAVHGRALGAHVWPGATPRVFALP